MNKYLSILKLTIDSFGFIVEQSGDGGDTAQREGSLVVYSYCALQEGKITKAEFDEIQDRYISNYLKLRQTCMPGEIRRHVDLSKWYGSSGRMSRDQWTPNVVALGLAGPVNLQLDMMIGMALRLFLFTTNVYRNWEPKDHIKIPDITVMSSWGYILRWLGPMAWPLLLVTDLELLINSLIWRHRMNQPDNKNSDILNHVIGLLQAKYKVPTPISWLARKLLDPNKVIQLLYNYHHASGPRMDLIAEDFLKDSWK